MNTWRPGKRYVILRHELLDNFHFDLMFESGEGADLWTWRSPFWPLPEPMVLEMLPNHRREYLEYEGPLTNNRGFVSRVESGTFWFGVEDDREWNFVLQDRSPGISFKVKKVGKDKWLAETRG